MKIEKKATQIRNLQVNIANRGITAVQTRHRKRRRMGDGMSQLSSVLEIFAHKLQKDRWKTASS